MWLLAEHRRGGIVGVHLEAGCDVVFQLGTANYGARNDDGTLNFDKLAEVAAHPNVKMVELKLSQGAKPGKGGILPAAKVNKEIAKIRGIPVHQSSISPNRHPEVDDIEQLLQHVGKMRAVTGKPVGFKAVLSSMDWVEELCAEINRRGAEHAPDFIAIDSGDGGTGAAPMPLMDNVGLTIRESLPLTVDVLIQAGLRDRIKVIASGKLITPAEVAWAYCAGADVVASARGSCLRWGASNPSSVTRTHVRQGLRRMINVCNVGLIPNDKAVRVKNFVGKIHYGAGLIAHSCGVLHPRLLERKHCRIVQPNGRSVAMSQLYPGGGKVAV